MVCGPFYNKNLESLRILNSEQADAIEGLMPKISNRLYCANELKQGFSNISLKSSNGGLASLFVSGNPEEELDKWLDKTELKNKQPHAVILLGFGLGYETKRIISVLSADTVIAVIEPDPFQFFTAIQYIDISDLLKNKQIHFYVGQSVEKSVESIGSELQWPRFLNLPHRIITTSFIQRMHPAFPQQFSAAWQDALQREMMYRRSRISHGETVVINTLSNVEPILNYPGVSTLFHHLENIPAILAAAGPSLDKTVRSMKAIQNRVLITCVNTAYPILRKYGVRPHIVFAMDHNKHNTRSFDNDSPSQETFLIADPRVNSGIINHFKPRVFLSSWLSTTEKIGEPAPLDKIPVPKMSGNAVYKWLQKLADNKGDIFGPGSVAVAGFHILVRLGCKQIILAGQDLAFTEQKAYANGTIFDDKKLHRDDQSTHEIPSVNGGSVGTSETLHLYRKLLEHEIARFKDITVFNISAGAMINGTITSRIESILDEIPEDEINITGHLKSLHQSFHPQADVIDLRRAMVKVIEQLQKFSEQARKALDFIPPDPELSLTSEQQKSLLEKLEEAVSNCTKDHQQAIELLNELLQETHFEFEDSRWRTKIQKDEKKVISEKLHNHARILDAFVRQSALLITLMEDKMEQLD